MENSAVAVIENGTVYFVRTDHIGRPVLATDATAAVVWEASYLPFGGVHTSTGTNSALRFPGQWYQSESGLHQNWMRDYDPTTGRYIQGDPLGLVDGASVYGYALQNPGKFSDPSGENATEFVGALIALDIATPEPTDAAAVPKAFIYGCAFTLALFVDGVTSMLCSCGDDGCPTPAEARTIAKKRGAVLLAQFKATGVGANAGRSGGHGKPHKNAGAELIREANKQSCPTLKAAFKKEGNRLIQQGKSISH
ncbi:MAG: RHS repeat-associated core domain-containing protein [Pseudomonadota bacterium]